MSEDCPFRLRGITPGDKAYVYDSWFNNLVDNDLHFKFMPRPVYTHHMTRIIDHHWENSQWLVLGGKTAEDWCAGYVCGVHTEASPLVHYVYVRKRYRGHGWGRQLVRSWLELGSRDSGLVYHSTSTRVAKRWEFYHRGKRKTDGTWWLGRRWMYSPWALTYGLPEGWWV